MTRRKTRTTSKASATVVKESPAPQAHRPPRSRRQGTPLTPSHPFDALPISEIWDRYQRSGDVELRNYLIRKHQHVVRTIAERIRPRLPAAVEVDDLVASGVFGLIDAINSFDPTMGVKFETFCGKRIQGAIYDNIRTLDDASRLARRREALVAEIRESFRKEHGRNPNDAEIEARISASPDEVQRIIRDSRIPTQTSFSAEAARATSDTGSMAESIPEACEGDTLVSAQARDLRDLVLRGLTPAERLVVILYYYQNMTMKEIGLTLGRSESRVSQMHSLIIDRLKSRLHSRADEFYLTA